MPRLIARVKPAENVLMTCGEKMWVSCTLTIWLRIRGVDPKKGLSPALTRLLSSMV